MMASEELETIRLSAEEATTAEPSSKATECISSCFPCFKKRKYVKIAPYQKLYISPRAFSISLNTLRLAIFVDAIAGTVEQPNYPVMASPGLHQDSFPNTGGLGFSAATYFIPMTAMLGVAIASIGFGTLSDRIGRKPCIVICLYGTVIGCVIKYLARKHFWLYCFFNFLNGLLSASVPVAMAYAGDVFETKREKEVEISNIVGISMLGTGCGGIIAILMATNGLFTPLLVASAIVFVSAVLSTFLLIEPKVIVASRKREKEDPLLEQEKDNDEEDAAVENTDQDLESDEEQEEEEEEDGIPVPKTLNKKVFANIVVGAVLDSVGSSGLTPLCLSPLAFNAFYRDIPAGEPVIMSLVGYKWISVLVMLMVVPGTILAPLMFNKIGLGGTCVFGNVATGIVTIVLLYIVILPKPSYVNFSFFVIIKFLSFPFTVFSQLTTGPMLEAISPPPQRGMAQGVNISVMNFAMAVSPVVLGAFSDKFGTPVAIWIAIVISFLAAIVNVPLMRVPGCGLPPKPRTPEMRPLKGEDKDLVERALRGSWIPARDLEQLNEQRFQKGDPYLVIHPRKYEDEKDHLDDLRNRAKDDYVFHRMKYNEYLTTTANSSDEEIASMCEKYNQAVTAADKQVVEKIRKEMGQWFVSYLVDMGYLPEMDSTILKQSFMSAFPEINKEKTVNPENVERTLLNMEKVVSRLGQLEGYREGDEGYHTLTSVLANASRLSHQQTL